MPRRARITGKLRWAKFWWADWKGDARLGLCSLAAQGVLMQLLCIAMECEPFGYVKFGSRIPSTKELCRLINPHPRPADLDRWIAELVRHEVLSRDRDGSMSSPSHLRVISVSRARTNAANARWNKQKHNGDAMQNHANADIEAEAEADPDRGESASAFSERARERNSRLKGARSRTAPYAVTAKFPGETDDQYARRLIALPPKGLNA